MVDSVKETSSTHDNQVWDPGKYLSHHLSYISGVNDVLIGSTDNEWEGGQNPSMHSSRTELDTHANMPVVGSECFVIAKTGKTAQVHPY